MAVAASAQLVVARWRLLLRLGRRRRLKLRRLGSRRERLGSRRFGRRRFGGRRLRRFGWWRGRFGGRRFCGLGFWSLRFWRSDRFLRFCRFRRDGLACRSRLELGGAARRLGFVLRRAGRVLRWVGNQFDRDLLLNVWLEPRGVFGPDQRREHGEMQGKTARQKSRKARAVLGETQPNWHAIGQPVSCIETFTLLSKGDQHGLGYGARILGQAPTLGSHHPAKPSPRA